MFLSPCVIIETWPTIPDDWNVAISSLSNLISFVYTILTEPAALETTFAVAPLVSPTTNSPWIVSVNSADLLIRLILGRLASPVVLDSYIPKTLTTSGRFKDISLSWTLVP